MKVVRSVGALVAGVALGVAVALLLFPEPKAGASATASGPVGKSPSRALIAEVGAPNPQWEAEEAARLRKRIVEIEGELRKARVELTAAETNGAVLARKPLDYDEWFELQRKLNPQRYTQMTNAIAASVQRTASDALVRAEALASVDVSSLDEDAASCHAEYCDALVRLANLRREEIARRCLSKDFKPDMTSELWNRIRETGRQVNELAARDRFALLGEAGRLHGMNAADAREMAETMHLIVETTSSAKGILKFQREHLLPSSVE